MHLTAWPSRHPIRALILCFAAWKSLILIIAACSPGRGYDTSTSLSLANNHFEHDRLPEPFDFINSKLIRWDAIYFVRVANRGYLFEQEWAFGWGFTRLIALFTTAIKEAGVPHYEGLEGLVAIIIAHSSHLLSSFALFKLTAILFPGFSGLPLSVAFLHIISPAGIFLSAPYAESSCALMSFLGCLFFVKSLGPRQQPTVIRDILVLMSGISFGVATTFRSNGILFGSLLLEEAFRNLFILKSGLRLTAVRRLVATGFGGLSVAAGFLLPQYIAYSEYCRSSPSRLWCDKTLPSIYTFVQEHYWNQGLFRYWTLSNVPLFLLAAPVLFILIISGMWALGKGYSETAHHESKEDVGAASNRLQVLRNLALSQLALAVFTFAAAHVQMITRMSSAYPVWVWYLAISHKGGSSLGKRFVGLMVIYAVIQAGLFASFLPPA